MVKCKDCIHYDLCLNLSDLGLCTFDEDECEIFDECGTFKEKSRFIELPCKVGDVVYIICDGEISEQKVNRICFDGLKSNIETLCPHYFDCEYGDPCMVDVEVCEGYYSDYLFGKDVFLTREEAEKKLEELKGETNES